MTREQAKLLRKAYDSVRAAQMLRGEKLYDFAISACFMKNHWAHES